MFKLTLTDNATLTSAPELAELRRRAEAARGTERGQWLHDLSRTPAARRRERVAYACAVLLCLTFLGAVVSAWAMAVSVHP